MSGVSNEPTMNIVNQINAALQDVRASLVEMAQECTGPAHSKATKRAQYQLGLTMTMINDYHLGINRPWSTLKYQVDEEFS